MKGCYMTTDNEKIDNFINGLQQEKNTSEYTNQYSNQTKNYESAANNLKLYLNNIYTRKPEHIFIGESPGYRGCRITGIPFTSEYILVNNKLFGVNNGYKIVNENNLHKENTATIIWQYFEKSKLVPFFWNAFPFHPHKIENTESNRKPSRHELDIGKMCLKKLTTIFNVRHFVSIGKIANKILNETNIDNICIRHPSNGGKNDFILGMNKLLQEVF